MWMAVNDMAWSEMTRISEEAYNYDTKESGPLRVPLSTGLLAFVDGGIYNSRTMESRHMALGA